MESLNEKYYIAIQTEPLNLNHAFEFINSCSCGGNSFFLGTTRDYEIENNIQVPIYGLYYEAYNEMAIKKMKCIINGIMNRNENIEKCYLVHRLGIIKKGESSILIATTSKGRNDCTQETLNILNEVKKYVPIWKKVIFEKQNYNKDQTNWIMNSEAFWL